MIKDEILTIDEVARYLKLSKHTLYKLAERGKLPSFKAGKRLRFRKQSIDRWVRLQERANSKRKK